MEAHLLLADSAQRDSVTGKVHILGGGWNLITGPAASMAVVVFLRAGWDELTDGEHAVMVRLLDKDGRPAMTPGLGDDKPIEAAGKITLVSPDAESDPVGRELGFETSFAVNVVAPLQPGHRYRWILELDGKELADVAFGVRAVAVPDARS